MMWTASWREKLDSGLSVSTVRRIRSVLAQALTQAIRWGMVSRNVASLTRGPRQVRKEGRTLTPSQAKGFLAKLARPSQRGPVLLDAFDRPASG